MLTEFALTPHNLISIHSAFEALLIYSIAFSAGASIAVALFVIGRIIRLN